MKWPLKWHEVICDPAERRSIQDAFDLDVLGGIMIADGIGDGDCGAIKALQEQAERDLEWVFEWLVADEPPTPLRTRLLGWGHVRLRDMFMSWWAGEAEAALARKNVFWSGDDAPTEDGGNSATTGFIGKFLFFAREAEAEPATGLAGSAGAVGVSGVSVDDAEAMDTKNTK